MINFFTLIKEAKNGKAKFYPYRTATVEYPLMNIGGFCNDDKNNKDVEYLKRALVRALNVNDDNHICFSVLINGVTIGLRFSDGCLSFGFGIKERRW